MASNDLSVKATLESLRRIDPHDDVATRQSLISRLRRLDDKDSWSSFFDVYWRVRYSPRRAAGGFNDGSQQCFPRRGALRFNTPDEKKKHPHPGGFPRWCLPRIAR